MSAIETEKSSQQGGGLREAQRRFTKRHILEAATAVFVAKGYTASTVEDIIERAGTSRRTFYVHFRSKTHLLAELSTTLAPEIRDQYRQLDEALLAESSQALREWFVATIDWCRRHDNLMPVWEQAAATEPEQETQRRAFIASLPDSMPHYLARWPKQRQEEARLRIILLNLQLDRFFVHTPVRDMEAADLAFVPDVLTNIWYEPLQAPSRTRTRPTRRRPGKQPGVEPPTTT